MQPTGALQYLKYSTPYLTVTWRSKAQSYITPVLTDLFHQHYIFQPLRATESAGCQLNLLAVKVSSFQVNFLNLRSMKSKNYEMTARKTQYANETKRISQHFSSWLDEQSSVVLALYDTIRSLRNSQPFPSIRARTDKFYKSFLPYCLKNFTQSVSTLKSAKLLYIVSDRCIVILYRIVCSCCNVLMF